jgi:hypothetical protein
MGKNFRSQGKKKFHWKKKTKQRIFLSPTHTLPMANLILASKSLFNETVAEQQQEIAQLQQQNQLLQLRLFFEGKGSQSAFNSCRAWSNCFVTRCACYTCTADARYIEDYDALEDDQEFANKNTWTCCWQPWFDELLQQRGFVVSRGEFGDDVAPAFDAGTTGHREHVAIDCHFSLVGRCDWQFWSFGTKLHGAQQRDDVEIQKYENLLQYVEDGACGAT